MQHFDYDSSRVLTVRMEDLVIYPKQGLSRIFGFFNVRVAEDFWEVVDKHSFRAKSGGRQTGEPDLSSHYRSGNPFDWTNYLSYSHAHRFYAKYSAVIDRFYPEVARLFNQ
jgi:hypothetical protein